jgi:H+/Na+-translocating ferredoxin:NAD+ oxidoreductase subunit C
MNSTLEEISLKIKQLWTFHGGLNIASNKSITHNLPIRQTKIPRKLILPLSQHIGREAIPVVNIGDKVLKGQVIADLEGHVSARIHAPSSGIITDIDNYPIPHPSGLSSTCIVIETDGKDQWMPLRGAPASGPKNPNNLSSSEIHTYIENAGIVGLGGAVFPSAVKLDVAPGRKIHTVIINAAECEPYITCDDALMQERAEEIILGARLIQKALSAERCIIAMEDDIPDTYQIMLKATQNYTDNCIQVVQLPERYPTGSEKQLIKILTNLEVPHQQLPSKIGIICINVGTAAAIYQSVYSGEPLISRVITITGKAVKKPGNIEALFGTPLEDLLEEAEVDKNQLERLIMGGPMMGYTLKDTNLPLVKSSNCLLAASHGELQTPLPAMPCIRCARCADSCPMNLLPQQMYWHAKSRNLEKTLEYNIFDCIECGCCSYVCPSNIPLVQYFRYAKAEIRSDQTDKKKADMARQRHEFRESRIALAKAEKAAQAAKRKKILADKKAAAELKQAQESSTEKQQESSTKKQHEPSAEKQQENSSTEKKKVPDTDKNEENSEIALDPIKAAMQRVQAKKALQNKTKEQVNKD